MNKFKKILLGALSVLTLGLVVITTGVKVDAETTTYTYDWYTSVFKNGATTNTTIVGANSNADFELASSENADKKMQMNINNTSTASFRYKSDGYVEFQKSSSRDATITFTFTTFGDAKLTAKLNTGGGKKPYYYKIDNGALGEIKIGTNGGEDVEFKFTGKGEHTLFLREATEEEYLQYNNKTGNNSNLKIYSFEIEDNEESAASKGVVTTVTPLQQEAIVGDSTFVRFVFIISNATNIDTYDFTDALHLCLDADKVDGPVVDRTPKLYTRLTSKGETYSTEVKGNDYVFDNSINTSDVYLLYVVEFTTAKYLGHDISAELEYMTGLYKTTPYTFV